MQHDLILAIESTAHTLSTALLTLHGKVVREARHQLTTSQGGLIPIKIQEHHLDHITPLLTRILTPHNATRVPSRIRFIALSTAPGIGHALRVGEIIATTLSLELGIPIIPVHHGLAHLTSALLLTDKTKGVLLYTSGANTQLYAYENNMLYLIGETLDMSLGNMLDSTARLLGLGFPGGPLLEREARKGKTLLPLPYTIKGMDVSYAGFYTAVKRLINQGHAREDIAMSIQEHAFALILEAAERGMALINADFLSIIGGVALNTRFKEMASQLVTQRGAKLIIPPPHLLGDNAIMIGLEALRKHTCEHDTGVPAEHLKAHINPYARIPSPAHYERCFTLTPEDLTPEEEQRG